MNAPSGTLSITVSSSDDPIVVTSDNGLKGAVYPSGSTYTPDDNGQIEADLREIFFLVTSRFVISSEATTTPRTRPNFGSTVIAGPRPIY
jgi:hypothetical protein